MNGPYSHDQIIAAWCDQAAFGTAGAPDTAVGLVNPSVTTDADLREVFGIGGEGALFLREGVVNIPFELPLTALQDGELLTKVFDNAGAAQWLTFAFGVDLGDTVAGWLVQDCRLSSFEVQVEGGSYLSGTLRGFGRKRAALAAGTVATLAAEPFMCQDVILTKGGAAYEAKSFRLSVNRNLTPEQLIAGAARAAGEERLWDVVRKGRLQISGEVSRYRESGIALTAKSLAAFPMVLAAADGTNTLTFTLAGVKFGSERFEGSDENGALYTTPFMATGITVAYA